MRHLKFLVAIILMMVVVILLVENNDAFSTKVVFKLDFFTLHYKSSEISMYYIVGITFFFGLLLAGLYGIVERYQLKREIKTLVESSMEKDKELNSLRNLPINSENVVSGDLDQDER